MAVANPSAGIFDALFYNTGTYASPTLVKLDSIENLTFDDDRTVMDLKTRRNMTVLHLTGLRTLKLGYNIMTEPGGTNWDAIHGYYNARTAVEMFVFYKYTDNAGAPTTGDKAIRLNTELSKFSRSQELEGIDFNEVEHVPSARLQGAASAIVEPAVYTAA